jgi:hypothetical protein
MLNEYSNDQMLGAKQDGTGDSALLPISTACMGLRAFLYLTWL